jgi:hypothetical protein
MKLTDRIRRWWAPARWRDEHPEISDGDGFSPSADGRLNDVVSRPRGVEISNWAGNRGGTTDQAHRS